MDNASCNVCGSISLLTPGAGFFNTSGTPQEDCNCSHASVTHVGGSAIRATCPGTGVGGVTSPPRMAEIAMISPGERANSNANWNRSCALGRSRKSLRPNAR